MTALTTNGSAVAATTLVTAGKLFNTTGGTSGNTSTKVGSGTQFKQIFALGTTTNQTGVASIPTPTDSNFNGWMWDVATLEGQRLAAGTFTPTIHLLASTSTTVTPTVAWYKRSSGGAYTSIGSVAGSSIALTTSSQALTFTPPSLALMDFATGDKLVMWLWVNQTAGGATNSTISVVEATSGSSAGVVSEAQTVTPGFAPTPVVLSVTMPGVGTVAPTLSATLGLPSLTLAGVGTFATYQYKKKIVIDHTKVAGGSDLSNFPVLLSFTDTNLKTVGSGGSVQSASGYDIIFLNSTETAKLDHEIENYVASTGEIEMWVRIPTLSASVDTVLYCYFGNSAISFSQENVTGVWDSNYVAVWHMDDATTTTIVDSTVTSATGTKQSASHPVSATGEIASAQSFNGTTDFISVASSTPRVVGDKTLECWVNASTFAANADTTLGKVVFFNADGTNVFMLITETSPAGFQWTVFDSALEHDIAASIATTATWYHVTATYAASGSVLALYLNGVSHANTVTTGVGKGTTGTGRIGNSAAGNGFYTGLLDEVRISNAVRTQGWATTSYNNQSNPSTFYSVGADLITPSQSSALSTTLAGVGTLSGTLGASGGAVSLSGTYAGVGVLSGTLSLATRFSDTLAGIGTLTASAPQFATILTVTLVGAGTLSGTLSLSGGSVALSGECDGVGTLSGIAQLSTVLTTTLAGRGTLTATIIPNNLVIRRGTSLLLNGATFRFSGANMPWLGLKNLAYPATSEIDDALQTAVEMGSTVVRAHTLGVSTGNSFSIQPFGVTYPTAAPFNNTAFNTIDYAIYRAGQLGIKLIIPLTDDYHFYHGGKHDFTDYRGVAEANFYTDANVLGDFEAYISHVLNRTNQYSGVIYKNDTTIMAWETGNELQTATVAWTDTIAQYIKSIDPLHLILCGKTLHGCIADGTTSMFSLASLDMLTDHFYPPNNTNVTSWASTASTNTKVYYIGEYDWTDTSGDTLASWLSTIEGNTAISGDSPWDQYGHRSTNGFIAETSGDVYALWYPGQTTATRAAQTKLRNHGFTIAGLGVPASSTPAAPTGVAVTVNQVTWHGVVAANTYDVERSTTSGTGPFSVIGTGLTDLDTPWTDTDTTPSTRYYRIRAYNIDGVAGAYSSVVTVGYLGVTTAGVGTLSGTSQLTTALTTTFAGIGTLTGTSQLTTSLSTTLVGVGTLTGTPALKTSLATSMAGVGTLSGTSSLTTALTDTLVGMGTLSGTIIEQTALATTMTGIGQLAGTLSSSSNAALAAECDGIGVVIGTLAAITPLTVYTLNTQDTTITTANILATALGGTQGGTATTAIGTSTGYGEIYARGHAVAWPAFASVQSPNGSGYLLDSTVLEGQTIPAGNWTPAFRILLGGSATTATADLIVAVYKYNITSLAYTSIGTCTLLGQSLTVGSNFTWAATSLGAMSFGIGDRLYFETWQNITVGSNSGTGTVRWAQSTNATLGVATDEIITPGYSQTSGFLAVTMAGVGTLTGTTGLTTSLSITFPGVGTLTGTGSFASALSTPLSGTGALTGAIALTTALAVQLPAVGTLSGTGSFAFSLPSVSLVGSGTLTGTLDTSTHVALAITFAGVGTLLVGTPALTTSLSTSILVGSGTLGGIPTLTTSFLGTLGGEGTLVGTLGLQTVLTANMVGTGILASTLFLSTALTASFLGTGTATALFSMQVALSLLVVGKGTSSAVINALGEVVLSLRPIGSLPPSSYGGKTVVPARPAGVYMVNGIPLDSQPIVCTAPLESGGGLRFLVGSTFFLLFDRPSLLTQTLLPDGGVVSMTFALASGNMVTVPQVQVASTLVMGVSISTFAVTCTLLSSLATPTLSLASSS